MRSNKAALTFLVLLLLSLWYIILSRVNDSFFFFRATKYDVTSQLKDDDGNHQHHRFPQWGEEGIDFDALMNAVCLSHAP